MHDGPGQTSRTVQLAEKCHVLLRIPNLSGVATSTVLSHPYAPVTHTPFSDNAIDYQDDPDVPTDPFEEREEPLAFLGVAPMNPAAVVPIVIQAPAVVAVSLKRMCTAAGLFGARGLDSFRP